jgi:hypothetical protein
MPNLDGNHYFFTALVPVWNEGIVEHDGIRSSPIHMVREALETLPTALQSKATEKIGIQSPFARSLRTHFVRFVIVDQPFYNGRDRADALASAVCNRDLLKAEPSDSLSCPYIFVMIDFDPDGDEPCRYCQELWDLMPKELSAVFRYCYGFSEVNDAKSFANFLLPCQVETTMPFNDYWVGAPLLTSMSKEPLIALPVAALVLPPIASAFGYLPWWTGLLLGIALAVAGLAIDYYLVMRRGGKPLPSAPNATLRHVLKALYLQQAFTRFAIEQQGRDIDASGAAFRAFLAKHRPKDLKEPTQEPGVIRSKFEEIKA